MHPRTHKPRFCPGDVQEGPLKRVEKNAKERLSVQWWVNPLSLRRGTAFERFLDWGRLTPPSTGGGGSYECTQNYIQALRVHHFGGANPL